MEEETSGRASSQGGRMIGNVDMGTWRNGDLQALETRDFGGQTRSQAGGLGLA